MEMLIAVKINRNVSSVCILYNNSALLGWNGHCLRTQRKYPQ